MIKNAKLSKTLDVPDAQLLSQEACWELNEHAHCGRVPAKLVANDSSHPRAHVPLFPVGSEIHFFSP